MKILVSMRIVDNAGYPERRDAISHDWMRLFKSYGVVPVLVPNAIGDLASYFTMGAAGILLTGGDDLGPDGSPTERDLTEEELLTGALERQLPVLGVCRGLQTINRHFSGEIARSLPVSHVGEHEIRLADGEVLRVNSFHNQGVVRSGLAPSLIPFAFAANEVVEGIRHRELPILAMQWHPERPSPSSALDDALLREWLNRCE